MRPKPRIRLLDLFVKTTRCIRRWGGETFCYNQLFPAVTVWRPSSRQPGSCQMVRWYRCFARPTPPHDPSVDLGGPAGWWCLSSAPYRIPHTVRCTTTTTELRRLQSHLDNPHPDVSGAETPATGPNCFPSPVLSAIPQLRSSAPHRV